MTSFKHGAKGITLNINSENIDAVLTKLSTKFDKTNKDVLILTENLDLGLAKSATRVSTLNTVTGEYNSTLSSVVLNQKKLTAENEKQAALNRTMKTQVKDFDNQIGSVKSKNKNLLNNMFIDTPHLKQSFSQLDGMMKDFSTGGKTTSSDIRTQIGKVNNVLGETKTGFDKATKGKNAFFGDLGKVAMWGIAMGAIYAPLKSFQDALKDLHEINTQVTTIAKVTGQSIEEVNVLAKKATGVGISMGRTAQEYLASVGEFSKAGYGQSAEDLGKLSLLLQNIGGMAAEEANQFLLATDAAYKFKGSQEELGKVIDSVVTIDNKYATSTQKISDGMTVTGSIAQNAGVSVQELAATIGTMTSITQRSGDEAGRAFRGILMNIRQVKGETADGDIIDDKALSKSAKALAAVGVKVHELRNGIEELRNPMDVLKDLADKWKGLSSMQQSPIIDALGGKYRGNQLVALVDNFKTYQSMLTDELTSTGAASKMNDVYMKSWDASANKLSSTMTKFWQDTLNTQSVIDGIDLLTTLVSAFGNLGVVIGAVGGILLLFKASSIVAFLAKHAETVGTLITNFKGFVGITKVATATIEGEALATESATVATTGFGVAVQTALGVIGALVAIISLVTMVINLNNAAKEESMQKTLDEVDVEKQKIQALDDSISKYEDYANITKFTSSQKSNLKTIQDSLINTYGDEAKAIDLLNGKYDENIQKLKDLEAAKNQKIVDDLSPDYGESMDRLNERKTYKIVGGGGERLAGIKNVTMDGTGSEISGNASERIKAYSDIIKKFSELQASGATITDNEKKYAQSAKQALEETNKEYEKFFKTAKQYQNALFALQQPDLLKNYKLSLEAYAKAKEGGDIVQITKAKQNLRMMSELIVEINNKNGGVYSDFATSATKSISDILKGNNDLIDQSNILKIAISDIYTDRTITKKDPFGKILEGLYKTKNAFDNGKISAGQYFSKINKELANLNMSDLSKSFSGKEGVAAEFFSGMVSEVGAGISNLNTMLETGGISAAKYLDGIGNIGKTLNILSESLQSNADSWIGNTNSVNDNRVKVDANQKQMSDILKVIAEDQKALAAADTLSKKGISKNTQEYTKDLKIFASRLADVASDGIKVTKNNKTVILKTEKDIISGLISGAIKLSDAQKIIGKHANSNLIKMSSSMGLLLDTISDAMKNFKAEIKLNINAIGGNISLTDLLGKIISGKPLADGDLPTFNFKLDGSSTTGGKIVNQVKNLAKDVMTPTTLDLNQFTGVLNGGGNVKQEPKPKKTSSSSSGGGSADVSAPEKSIIKDRYASFLAKEESYNAKISKIKADIEKYDTSSVKNMTKRISLYDKEIKALKDKNIAIGKTNKERKKEASELKWSLKKSNIKFDADGFGVNYSSVVDKMLKNLNSHKGDKNKTTYNKLKDAYDSFLAKYTRYNDLISKDIIGAAIDIENNRKNIEEINHTKANERYTQAEAYVNSYIESLRKQQKLESDGIQKQIDALTKERDLKQQINDETKKAADLASAEKELSNAKRNKTIRRLGLNGRWEMVADQTAVDSAQKNVTDLKNQAETDVYNNQIDGLTTIKDGVNGKYDSTIQNLTDSLTNFKERMDGSSSNLVLSFKNLSDVLKNIGVVINGSVLTDKTGTIPNASNDYVNQVSGIKLSPKDPNIISLAKVFTDSLLSSIKNNTDTLSSTVNYEISIGQVVANNSTDFMKSLDNIVSITKPK